MSVITPLLGTINSTIYMALTLAPWEPRGGLRQGPLLNSLGCVPGRTLRSAAGALPRHPLMILGSPKFGYWRPLRGHRRLAQQVQVVQLLSKCLSWMVHKPPPPPRLASAGSRCLHNPQNFSFTCRVFVFVPKLDDSVVVLSV